MSEYSNISFSKNKLQKFLTAFKESSIPHRYRSRYTQAIRVYLVTLFSLCIRSCVLNAADAVCTEEPARAMRISMHAETITAYYKLQPNPTKPRCLQEIPVSSQ